MKKIFMTLLVLTMVISLLLPLGVMAQENIIIKKADECSTPEPPMMSNKMDIMTPTEMLIEPIGVRLASITVYINEPCDEEWRNDYPSTWAYRADNAIEWADNKLYDWFGIDYISVAQNQWSSSSTTDSALLQEAIDDIGKTNGADIMVAFTGQNVSGSAGLGRIGSGFSLVEDNGSTNNGIIARHETGHNYGLRHCDEGTQCLMVEDRGMYTYYDQLCSTHNTQWDNNKNDF